MQDAIDMWPRATEYRLTRFNPFFSFELNDWLKSRGFTLRELRAELGTIPNYEYTNTNTGIRITFVDNSITVSGRHKSQHPYGQDAWIDMWSFTNPMRAEAVKAILKAYKNSI